MDVAPPRTLCLSSVAQVLSQVSRLKPDRMAGDQDVGWQSKVWFFITYCLKYSINELKHMK